MVSNNRIRPNEFENNNVKGRKPIFNFINNNDVNTKYHLITTWKR